MNRAKGEMKCGVVHGCYLTEHALRRHVLGRNSTQHSGSRKIQRGCKDVD